ncbi:putative B3 domain-containing protein At5g66980 [Silene latifolia]|uniref:putative B3 domain-containing protein At5g66980 n=1 Tax=Silene latifolia TaxID=37657 RepID=UPI003D7737E7
MGKTMHPNNLQFFQPLLPDFLHNFAIPISFVEHLEECNGEQDEKAELKDKNGRSWGIKVISKNSRKYFKDGWDTFCKDNDLHVGDFLVFRHQGNLRFEVLIFDSTSCERQIPPLRDPQFQHVDEANKDDQVMPDIREEGDNLHCFRGHGEAGSVKDDHMNYNDPYLQCYPYSTRPIISPHSNETQANYESQHYYYPTAVDYSLLTHASVFNYNHASSLLAHRLG